jgi:phosphoglycolate phosphatase-like HAD superfamily hydrolase
MKIKNIIFDFDGVLVRNTDLLLETHQKYIG